MEVAELRARAMASEVLVVVVASDRSDIDPLLDPALARVGHLEDRWSRFRPDSDVSRINRVGGAADGAGGRAGGVVAVDPATVTLLDAMLEGYQRTAGRFDPTQLPALLAAGYTSSIDDPGAVCELGPAAGKVGSSLYDLTVDAERCTVTVPPGLALDAGGVGKGLAADLVVAELVDGGAAGALVSIGGDLACRGEAADPDGWLVDVEAPDAVGSTTVRLALSGGGVATSSVRSRRWTVDGEERHHQIDPSTARCAATDLDAVTVVAPSGWLAEVHATAALAVGSSRVVPYLEGHGLDGVAHAADGRILATSGLSSFLSLRSEVVR